MNRTGSYNLNHHDEEQTEDTVSQGIVVDSPKKAEKSSAVVVHSYTRKYSQYGKNKKNKHGAVSYFLF